MFGIGIQRGFTMRSDGLAEGYVFFSFPILHLCTCLTAKEKWYMSGKVTMAALHRLLTCKTTAPLFITLQYPDFPVFAGGASRAE